MSDETNKIEPLAPFLYAVVYPSGEIFTTHKNKRIALGIAMQEREWVAGCTVIPLYAVPKSLSESVSLIDGVEDNISAKEIFLGLSSAALKRENELEQKLAESQREFRAADATIENLQMQLEKLAAENAGLDNFIASSCFVYAGELGYWPAIDHSPEIPVTNQLSLVESRFLTDVMTAAGLLSCGKRDKQLAQRLADYCVSKRMGSNPAQIRKGVQS